MPREADKWARGKLSDGRGFRPYIPKEHLQLASNQLQHVDVEEPLAYRRDVHVDGNRLKVTLTIWNRGPDRCPVCEAKTEHITMSKFVQCLDCGKKHLPAEVDATA